MIPARVVTYAAVVRCESLLQLSWVDAAAGFDVSPMNSFRHSKMRLRRMSKDWGFMLSEADPPAEMVAGPFEIMTVDFLSDRATAFDGGVNVTHTLPVRPGSGGEVHAVVAWFEAELDPAGEIRLSTSPWATDNSFARQQHWGRPPSASLDPSVSPSSRPARTRDPPQPDPEKVSVDVKSFVEDYAKSHPELNKSRMRYMQLDDPYSVVSPLTTGTMAIEEAFSEASE